MDSGQIEYERAGKRPTRECIQQVLGKKKVRAFTTRRRGECIAGDDWQLAGVRLESRCSRRFGSKSKAGEDRAYFSRTGTSRARAGSTGRVVSSTCSALWEPAVTPQRICTSRLWRGRYLVAGPITSPPPQRSRYLWPHWLPLHGDGLGAKAGLVRCSGTSIFSCRRRVWRACERRLRIGTSRRRATSAGAGMGGTKSRRPPCLPRYFESTVVVLVCEEEKRQRARASHCACRHVEPGRTVAARTLPKACAQRWLVTSPGSIKCSRDPGRGAKTAAVAHSSSLQIIIHGTVRRPLLQNVTRLCTNQSSKQASGRGQTTCQHCSCTWRSETESARS